MSQSKGKIIPVDKSILKLSEDTTGKVVYNKISMDFDYVIVTNDNTLKKDTILVYKDLYINKKRKPKN
jgi:hypothetical protein